MVSKELKTELGEILKNDYGIPATTSEIERLANDLVGYFDLLLRINHKLAESVKSPDLILPKD